MTPRATYRIQFQRNFTFEDGARIAPYLARLGISHLYSSPILTARAGSTHGYDVVDATKVNPELGGEEAFRRMVAALRAEGLGLVVDIVPNHMAVGGADNAWWLDVLENGRGSPYADVFDIDWDTPDPALKDKVQVPFLGAPYGEVLESGDLTLAYDTDLKRLAVSYHHHRYPIRPADYAEILRGGGAGDLASRFEAASDRDAFQMAAAALDGAALEGALERYREPHALHELLERQHYRLAWWRTAGDEINYRRFFEITELAGVRVERPEVFEAVHDVVFRLYAEGLIDGVRVDHVDGLADPAGYCRTLRARLAELEGQRPDSGPKGPAYIVVEKILAPYEHLPPDWQVEGTTGYDFLNEVCGVMHDPEGEEPFTELWEEVSDGPEDFETEELIARREILERSFAGQLEAAASAFHRLARADLATRDVSRAALRRAIAALLHVFPAYRTYATAGGAPGTDAPTLERAVPAAKGLAAPGEEGVIDLVAGWLSGLGGADPAARGEAVTRFQQLSAPMAAKSVEDTAFYRYGRLLSRNDVGCDPVRFAIPLEAFHESCRERAQRFPGSMLATATHDHKRGEDLRMRLAALSEVPERWAERIGNWFEANAGLAENGPEPGDEYQRYQMIVGAWLPGLKPDDAEGLRSLAERLAAWQEKALREGKLRSSWIAPDQDYENACRDFLDAVLDPARSRTFLDDVAGFVEELAPAGILNSLAQAFLRNTVPGMPDLYQGTELWDFSLVDPDNRRPVDYGLRADELVESPGWSALLGAWTDGRVKQALIRRLLAARAAAPGLFAEGEYLPLEVTGARAGHVIAFARRRSSSLAVCAATRLGAEAVWGRGTPLPEAGWWGDTTIRVPADLVDTELADALHGGSAALAAETRAADLFAALPVSLRMVR